MTVYEVFTRRVAFEGTYQECWDWMMSQADDYNGGKIYRTWKDEDGDTYYDVGRVYIFNATPMNLLEGSTPNDISAVATAIKQLNVGEEITFTKDDFESENLCESVFDALRACDYVCTLNCGIWRSYYNKDNKRVVLCDFRDDVVIVRRIANEA